MDANDGRSQPPPEARGEADLAPTTEFRAFLAGDPIPTDAATGPQDRPDTRYRLPACVLEQPVRCLPGVLAGP